MIAKKLTQAMKLPKYRRPPLAEVVFEVDFKPIAHFKAAHFGVIWQRFQSDYPTCEDKIPLFSADSLSTEFPNQTFPLPRVWMIHRDDSRVIQVQNDRFIFNWRKRDDEYPTFDKIYPEFKRNYDVFVRTITDLGLPELQPVRVQLSYVNPMPKGDAWNDISEISALFPDIQWRMSPDRFIRHQRTAA